MQDAVTIKQLRKVYRGGVVALESLDLRIAQGDFFALLGPNGAGKSTTIGIMTSLVQKTAGSVAIFGVDTDHDFSKAKSYLGLVPQEFNFNGFERVDTILLTQAGYYGVGLRRARVRMEAVLKQLGLWDKRSVRAQTLSGGMKRRLLIARALMHDPQLLILDEPTAGVDIEVRRTMWDFLRELNAQGKTIILTTHYLEEAESLCKNIAIIDRGCLIEHADTKSLLSRLRNETFLLDVGAPLNDAPILEGFTVEQIDEHTLAVDKPQGVELNSLFTQLTKLGIRVNSMRQKSNRLEELFLKLTSHAEETA